MRIRPRSRADAEAAAVDEVQDRKFGAGGGRRLEEAEVEAVRGVVEDVAEDDGAVVGGDRKGEVDVVGAGDGAVAVELEDAHAVLYDVREGTHSFGFC